MRSMYNTDYMPYANGNGSQAIMENGGVVNSGDEANILWGGKTTQLSDSVVDNPMFEFNGNTHKQGGIGLQYGNKTVEVEDDEVGYVDPEGALNVFGKTKVPGTNRTFKTEAKKIAKEEAKIDKDLTKTLTILNKQEPTDNYSGIAYNTAEVLFKSQSKQAKDISMRKQKLAALQELMLKEENIV